MSNHLLREKSPYLLQHAENPVDWYPWSHEAFERAALEDKPVFLSIGYSTCHWCHVMAHESFEDREVAKRLNADYVPVKVDREERPEIDMVYMSVCQAMTGQGGWPLTIIMTPDKKPFFAGTYLPKTSRRNMTGLLELLSAVSELWKSDRKRLLNMSDQILAVLRRASAASSPADPETLARRGYEELRAAFDRTYGGFGRAPKFPAPHNLLFLMRYRAWADEPQALAMAEKTLSSMARGGIHDHLGGGFSRYSTDQMWLVPHFEKMLYDNALLTLAYLEGYRLTGNRFYQRTARQILDYVRRELTGPEGGFYCGQDADSQGVEGKYYVFSEEEIGRVLGNRKDQEKFCRRYGITKEGNFEGSNILNLIHNPDYEQTDLEMDALCRRLYEYRLKRLPLHRDDKILASWNALMIIACARAGFLLDDPGYLEMAGRAQVFVEQKLFDENGRLLVRYRQGESAFPGNLDDYAFYCLALLTLYEVTLDASYLELAVNRAEQMVELFWDEERGGFYFYGSDVPELIDRPKELYDGAMPSGNSAAAHVLASLADLTANRDWHSFADRQLDFLAAGIADFPSAHSFSLTALMDAGEPGSQLVCVSAQNEVPGELYAYRREPEHGRMSILFKCPDNETRLSRLAPFTREYPVPDQGTCYYLCQNHTCGLPFTSLSEGMPGPRDLNGKENA